MDEDCKRELRRQWKAPLNLVVLARRSFDEIEAFWAALKLEHQMSYTLAKEAVVLWTLQMAHKYVTTGPRFNVLSPGFTDTPLLQRAFESGNETVQKLALSNNRISTPEEVARVAVFMCSDEAAVLNGSEILADGGLTATITCRECEI